MGQKTELKAIETLYKGHLFRSRLEARWSVFFDLLNIPFMYEAEGFNLNGLYYLPDFYLPEQDCFFEVKGPFTDNDGPLKARALAVASGKPVFMFGEIPPHDDIRTCNLKTSGHAFYPTGEDHGYFWCISRCCDMPGVQFMGRASRVKCCLQNKGNGEYLTYDHNALLMAYAAARAARFEGR